METLEKTTLKAFEASCGAWFDGMSTITDKMKLAVALSLVCSRSEEEIRKLDLTSFIPELQKTLNDNIEQYNRLLPTIKEHLEQNANIVKAIEKSQGRLASTVCDIKQKLEQLDKDLKELVKMRDNFNTEQLIKENS